MDRKIYDLIKIIKKPIGLAIAYSGGMDSGFLSLLATLNREPATTVAYLVKSEFIPENDYRKAKELANKYKIPLRIIDITLLEQNLIKINNTERCYYCKKIIYSNIINQIPAGWQLLDGSVVDDYNDFRPGKKALLELNVKSPMAELGICKSEIKNFLQKLGAKEFIQPSNSCLATRIPYNVEINLEKLKQIEKSEEFLQNIGFKQVRVRHHNDIARIEVEKNSISKLLEKSSEISNFIKKLGFKFVTIDLQGYKQGSLNY